jgi:micrococcal nuclease
MPRKKVVAEGQLAPNTAAPPPALKPSYEYRARVVRVLDGDTVEVDIEKDVGFDVVVKFRKTVRMQGINTPEKFGATKEAGLASKKIVQDLLPVGSEIVMRTEKPDSTEKFGRFLATIWLGNLNLSEHLISIGAAKPFDGKGKRE